MPTIEIPALLHKITTPQTEITVSGATVVESLQQLIMAYPVLAPYLLDEQNKICPFMAVYLNGHDVRHLQAEQTLLKQQDVLTLVPAVAGG